MAHPGLESLLAHAALGAAGTEILTEIMAADRYLLPRRQLLAGGEQSFVLLRFAVPALGTTVQLPFQKSGIGLILSIESGHGHHSAGQATREQV